jgi:hypothetical protein
VAWARLTRIFRRVVSSCSDARIQVQQEGGQWTCAAHRLFTKLPRLEKHNPAFSFLSPPRRAHACVYTLYCMPNSTLSSPEPALAAAALRTPISPLSRARALRQREHPRFQTLTCVRARASWVGITWRDRRPPDTLCVKALRRPRP